MKITFYGQNSLGIEIKGKHILVDPFISGNPLSKDKININDLKADYYHITPAHLTRTLDAADNARTTRAIIVSNNYIANYYEAKGMEVHAINHGGSWKFEFGKVKYVLAIHTRSFP